MAAGAALAASAAAHRRAIETADAAWAPYAKTHEMHHRPGRFGWAHAQSSRIDGRFDSVAVSFELAGVSRTWGTLALAIPLAPVPVNVEVRREGLLARIAHLFGVRDLSFEDEAFDRAFVVRATNEDAARALLDETTRGEMVALGVSTLAYDDGSTHEHAPMVVLGVPRIVVQEAEIDRVLQLLVKLARVRPETTPFR